MKHEILKTSIAGLMALSVAVAPACAETMVDGFAGKLPLYEGEGLVGFDIYHGGVARWEEHDIPNLKECLATYAPNVKLTVADPRGDAAQQMGQIQSMLVQGIDVLLATPVALTPTNVVNATKRAGVPWIIYLNPPVGLEEGDITALVGDGPVPIGEAQGQWIVDTQPEGAEIALINGDLATNYALLMKKGQMSVLQEYVDSGRFKLVADKGAVNWDPANAQKEAAAVLLSNPNLKAIIAGSDGLAVGITNAIKTAGRTGEIDVIGLDGNIQGTQNILLGNQTATVIRSFKEEMSNACVAVIYTLHGKPMPSEVFDTVWDEDTAPIPFKDVNVKIMTRDNIADALEYRTVTKEAMCEGLPESVGAPCF